MPPLILNIYMVILPVWIHLWMAKGEEFANLFPHLLHSKGIFPFWVKKYLVRDFPGGPVVKTLLVMQETWVQSLGWEDPMEKGKATRSNFLARRISAEFHGLVHRFTKSQTQLSNFHFTLLYCALCICITHWPNLPKGRNTCSPI